jgi:cytochrome P450
VTSVDMLSSEFHDNPHATYDSLRETDGGVHRLEPGDTWLVLRYADVLAVFRDTRTFSSNWLAAVRPGSTDPGTDFEYDARAAQAVAPSMLFSDPPIHTKLRTLVSKAFTPRAIEALRPKIESITESLLKQIPRGTVFDIIEQFASPLPVEVIADMLGVPDSDREQFARWSDASALLLAPALPSGVRAQARRESAEFTRYVRDVVASRQSNPGPDMISRMLLAAVGEDRLSVTDVVTMTNLLLVAGNETTRTLLTNCLLVLADHPEIQQRVRSDHSLIPALIEETLRTEPSVALTYRLATCDTILGGREIDAGAPLLLSIAAANRDPRVFDEPHHFRLDREPNRHIGFAAGPHFCLGAPLARLEATVALPMFLEHFPRISADPAARTRRMDALTSGYATAQVVL